MINITFPDGSVRQYESGVSAFDIANSISPRLAADVLAATVITAADTTGKGTIYDVTRPINEDASIRLHKWEDTEPRGLLQGGVKKSARTHAWPQHPPICEDGSLHPL